MVPRGGAGDRRGEPLPDVPSAMRSSAESSHWPRSDAGHDQFRHAPRSPLHLRAALCHVRRRNVAPASRREQHLSRPTIGAPGLLLVRDSGSVGDGRLAAHLAIRVSGVPITHGRDARPARAMHSRRGCGLSSSRSSPESSPQTSESVAGPDRRGSVDAPSCHEVSGRLWVQSLRGWPALLPDSIFRHAISRRRVGPVSAARLWRCADG